MEYKPSSDSLRLSGIWNFSYDKINRITEEQWILIGCRGHRDTSCWNYEYVGDTLTKIKKRYKFIGSYSEMYYSYLQKGNKEIFTYANRDSSYMSKKLFVYDKKNRLIRNEDYGNKEFVQDLRIYTYKDTLTRNVFKEVSIWAKYNDNFYRCHEYDENQNVVKRINGRFDKDSTSENRYEYVYDDHGNWIEKKHYGWKGRLVDVSKREIKYFE